ncbi:inner membrane protein YjdF [mine drainage metagenome]|uniref:Inner membrane protein YjdF n=1 Tax=mine drainage metagenome TaxID=410659 RepID=A0A1J5T7T4_9ZZZZ
MKTANEPLLLLVIGSLLLALTAIHPHDYPTWWMETAPIFIAAPILVATGKRYPLTPLVYRLLFVHALILMVGGHYTYAEVPLGYSMEHWFGLLRNDYDKIGHFAQGFVPALLFRELLLRRSPLQRGKLLFTLVTACCLAVSASYELVEWAAAVTMGQGADAFLGTQGDPWDTQTDMLMALIGAVCAQGVLGKVQDGQLRAVCDELPVRSS